MAFSRSDVKGETNGDVPKQETKSESKVDRAEIKNRFDALFSEEIKDDTSKETGEAKQESTEKEDFDQEKQIEQPKSIREQLDKIFNSELMDHAVDMFKDTISGKEFDTEGEESKEEDSSEKEENASDTKLESESGEIDNKDELESSVEKDELSGDEIDELQKDAIKDAFERIARGEKLTDAEKGNFGEMLMDQYYIDKGYKPIHSPRVTDLSHKSGQGIDGVYEKTNPDGTKSYIIADAKVNSSKLNKGLADGTDQMSSEWIDKRLDNAVGKEKADDIRDAYEDDPDSISKEVYHFSYGDLLDGTSTADVSTVDDDGNMNKDKKLAQVFDPQGKVIRDGTGGENDER